MIFSEQHFLTFWTREKTWNILTVLELQWVSRTFTKKRPMGREGPKVVVRGVGTIELWEVKGEKQFLRGWLCQSFWRFNSWNVSHTHTFVSEETLCQVSYNVSWAHHASVWVRVEDCPMGGYTPALPLRAPFVTDSSAAGARESLRPQTCRTKSSWDPPRRMDPARWRWRWEPPFRCSGQEDVAQWIFNVTNWS